MRNAYLIKKEMKKDDLYMSREGLLDLTDSEVWDHFIPFRTTSSGQIVHLSDSRDIREWYEGLVKKTISSDLKLTKKYFPDLYKDKLCGYVHHKKNKPDNT
jgi:hypothetical protein